MSMIYDYDSVNLNLCLWFQPAQVGLFQQVVGQHLLAWPGLSQEAYKWLIQNPFQCHPMAEELVIILRTSPHPIWSYPYLSVGYGWIWNILSTSNNDIIVKISPVARWIRLESPRVHRSAFRNIMVKSFPWTKPCVAMKFTGYYSLQPSKLLDPRSTQIYTDAAVTAVALVPWQMPIRKRHIQNRQGTMPGATETAGSHDFPWRNAWRLKDSLKEKLSKAMSLPSSLTLCSDSLKLSQTQMSFHDFTRKVFGKANFSLLRVKQMRLHVPFWTWRGKHSHLIMAKFLERSKYWPDVSATDFVQEGNCLKPGASSLTLIGHLIQDCLPSWRLDFVKDIQAEGPVSSTTTCSQEPGAVHTAWQILQTSASQGIQ